MPRFSDQYGESYDRLASTYAARLGDELRGKPLDRELLARLAAESRGTGLICDVGSGPGHVARFLADLGAAVIATDLSRGMMATARAVAPGMPLSVADMRQMPFADASLAGICALYSIIHIPPGERSYVFGEFRRVLRPGGAALVAFHLGDESRRVDEMWGVPVAIDFHSLRADAIVAEMRDAGLAIEDEIERAPYSGAEHPSRRGYVYARRPGA